MIVFNKGLSSDNLLHCFNNQNIEFYSNSVEDAVHCIISFNGVIYKITPNNNNVFNFNFGGNKSVFSTLLNQNDFADDVIPIITDVNSLSVDDTANNFMSVEVLYTITLANETTETITKTYNVSKSINKLDVIDDDFTSIPNNDIILLTPTLNLTYYKGYPLSVGYFIGTDTVTDIDSNNNTITLLIQSKIGKFVVSDGFSDMDDVGFTLNNYEAITILDKTINLKVEDFSGEYIKFINRYGKFSFILFKCKHKEVVSRKKGKSLFNDFSDAGTNPSRYIEVGVQNMYKKTLYLDNFSHKELMQDLFDSPKVYHYIKPKGTLDNALNWREVRVFNSSYLIEEFGNISNIKLTIQGTSNTMML